MGTDSQRRAATPGDDAATRLLAKLRAFVGTLQPDERAALAALLAPGVADAGRHRDDATPRAVDPVPWDPDRLAASLLARMAQPSLRIEFD